MSGECPGPSDAPFLVIFSTLAVAMTLATPWLARIWFDHWSLRYMYPLLVVPVLALADGGWLSLDRLGHAVAAGILILGTAVIGSQSVYLSLASLKYPYPEKIRCLDRVAMDFGVRHGLGGYWTAKYVSQLSRAGLRVNQIDPDLRVDPWINNLNWYGPRGEERAYPDYRFVVTDGLSAPRLVQTFGTPDLLARCADWTVLLYGEESGSPLRRFRLSP